MYGESKKLLNKEKGSDKKGTDEETKKWKERLPKANKTIKKYNIGSFNMCQVTK